MKELLNQMDTVEFITVVTVLIPFVVQAIRSVLTRFKFEVKPQVIVGSVCAIIALVYSLVTTFATADTISTIAEIGGLTFVTSQGLYKLYRQKWNDKVE